MLHVVLVLTDTLLHLDFGNSFGFKHHQFLKRYPASQGRFAHGLQPVKSWSCLKRQNCERVHVQDTFEQGILSTDLSAMLPLPSTQLVLPASDAIFVSSVICISVTYTGQALFFHCPVKHQSLGHCKQQCWATYIVYGVYTKILNAGGDYSEGTFYIISPNVQILYI